jgi:polyhydroxyalkanoate synthesis regulator phasin
MLGVEPLEAEATMSRLDDMRRTIEGAVGNMTPERAQKLAKSFEPNAAKEQVAKTAADILEWSQRNRERLTTYIRGEIARQMEQTGVATRGELDALKKRVRELERAAGMTASGRKKAASAKRSTAKRSTAKRSTAKRSAASSTPPSGGANPSSASPSDSGS